MSAVTRKISKEPISYDRSYTYEEWMDIELPEGVWRMELVDGKLYAMASPGPSHQAISGEFTTQFTNYLRGKRCKVYHGIEVRITKNTVYVPDLVVVCDLSRLTDRGYEGTPDLIIEILSPSNSRHDRITKLKAYRKAGVQEYWIVDPENHSVEAYRMANDLYWVTVYEEWEKLSPMALPGFEIDLSLVFSEEVFSEEEFPEKNQEDDQ